MLDSLTYGPSTSPLIIRRADGSTEGKNPKYIAPAELIAAGHTPQSILKILRAKCLDCCGGSRAEVTAAVGCALWPYRMGKNPFGKARGQNLPQTATDFGGEPGGLSYTGSDGSSKTPPQIEEVSGGAGPSNRGGCTASRKGGAQ
jgi:hypothetical protein